MKKENHIPANSMWIGPTIVKLGIRRGMLVVGDEPPPQLKNLLDTKPMYRSLFIPTSRITEARERIKVVGSLENLSTLEIQKLNREKWQVNKES